MDTICPGCDQPTAGYPYVVVVKEGDAFVAKPICRRCHEVPTARVHPIKGHFFHASQEKFAVLNAGSDTIGG